MQNLDHRRAGRLVLLQGIASVLLAAGAWVVGPDVARSTLYGGATATLGNLLFALWVFGRYRAGQPGLLAYRFYGGELLKLVVIAACFAAIFAWGGPVRPVALFVAFLLVQVVPPLLVHRIAD